uniref:Mucin-17-like n=2 Tax=Nannospalax galili TaxID=1026970 RepID=A0A8C6QGE6_NANGA
LNGGSWNGQFCLCPSGFTGDRCQHVSVICQNGGSWDGLKCQCTSVFYGPRCEYVVESIEIEQTVSASVEVTVRVTSEDFSEDLLNNSSQKFKDFSKKFTEQMAIIYAGIPEYAGVVIKELRRGSVVVDYDVILKAPYTQEYQEEFQNISMDVKEKIKAATEKQISGANNTCSTLLCFDSSATQVQNVSVKNYNPEETCKKVAGDVYSQYFTVEHKNDKLYCITPCMSGFKASLECNYGKCQLERSGPRCLCLTTDTHWYSGEACDWGIQKSLVYGLVGAGVAVLLVILVILLVFSIRYRREAQSQRSRVSDLYKWNEEEGRSTPGSFQNIGFDLREEREDYVHMDSMYSNFQPSLNNIDPERKIQIQRPQVVMTAL